MQESREELRRQIGTILNHDIRTPLSALIGHTELLREQVDELPRDVAISLGAIERAGWRLHEMVGSVVELLEQIDRMDRGQD